MRRTNQNSGHSAHPPFRAGAARAVTIEAGSLVLAAGAMFASCGGGDSSTPAATSPASASAAVNTGADAALVTYVEAICKAAGEAQQATAAARLAGGPPSTTPVDGATPNAPPADATGRAQALQDAGAAAVLAVQNANPPAALKSYNDELLAQLQQAGAGVANGGGRPQGTPGAGDGTRPAGGRATPDGSATPPAGGPGARGQGGFGGGNFLFRNLPATPANEASAMQAAAASSSSCQAVGITFAN